MHRTEAMSSTSSVKQVLSSMFVGAGERTESEHQDESCSHRSTRYASTTILCHAVDFDQKSSGQFRYLCDVVSLTLFLEWSYDVAGYHAGCFSFASTKGFLLSDLLMCYVPNSTGLQRGLHLSKTDISHKKVQYM